MEALFIYEKAETLLDKGTKRALRLCNKHFKNLVDATVTSARIVSSTLNDTLSDTLNSLINTEWHGLENL